MFDVSSRSRLIALLLATGVVFLSIPATASAFSSRPLGQDQDGIETEIPPGAGRIIGSPDAGPEPQQPGDRGGWAQLLTLGAVPGGVGFIMWRIVHALRPTPRPMPDP
jgi:hypothetical protein